MQLAKRGVKKFPGFFHMCELQRGAKLLKEIKMENERAEKSSMHLIQAVFKHNGASYAGRKIPSLLCMDDFSRE